MPEEELLKETALHRAPYSLVEKLREGRHTPAGGWGRVVSSHFQWSLRGTVIAPVTRTALISGTGKMDPLDLLEIVVFIYVSILSADMYYMGFLCCVSSAALP